MDKHVLQYGINRFVRKINTGCKPLREGLISVSYTRYTSSAISFAPVDSNLQGPMRSAKKKKKTGMICFGRTKA